MNGAINRSLTLSIDGVTQFMDFFHVGTLIYNKTDKTHQ